MTIVDESSGDVFELARSGADALPLLPVHARVLTEQEGGRARWVFVVWSDAGGAPGVHRALRDRVEAAFLAELSRPLSSFESGEAPLGALRLVVWPSVAEVGRAVRAFGFKEDTDAAESWRGTLALVRGEAQRVGAALEEAPASRWHASVALPPELEQLAARFVARLLREKASDVWGAEPGRLYALLAAELGLRADDVDGTFRRMESALVSGVRGAVRYLPPVLFQALTDGAGAYLTKAAGRRVAWGLSETDEEGLVPPPILQLEDGSILPIGLELLRWCVMPLGDDEPTPPPFADWLLDFRRA